MTDRPHSCKHSPDGKHHIDTGISRLCRYCFRSVNYLTDLGWNAPAVDPDAHMGATEPGWQDEEADVRDTRPVYRVVNTDNFGSDYPNESFVGGELYTEDAAQTFADEKNGDGDYNPRYYKVERLPYALAPGFEP